MALTAYRMSLALGTAIGLTAALPAAAQDMPAPGDRSGTATSAGSGQSAASVTNAPAPEADPRAADAGNPGDIIVTARRVEERLQDVPISITVLNQQQLTNRNVVNSTDLATYTPSLAANSNFGQENTSFAIRGFVQDAGTPPSVGVYFADVVAPRGPTQGTQAGDGAGPGSFFDLQNVQVLKGPQGTLFGRNTTGGAILLVPQRPTTRFEGYLEGSYGNYNMYRVQGAINIPLGDNARFRFSGDHLQRDGYLHNRSGIGPGDFNDVGYTALRASLIVDLTPNLENYTIASWSHSSTNGSVQRLIGCIPNDPPIGSLACGQLGRERSQGYGFYDIEQATPDPVSRIDQWQVINTTTWRASDTLTLKNIASYAQFVDYQRSSLFGTNFQAADVTGPTAGLFFLGAPRLFTGIFAAPGLHTADQSTFTDEIQLQGSANGGRLTYQAGAYLEVSNPLGAVGNQSPQLAACTDASTFTCTDPLGSEFTTAVSAQTSAALGFPISVPVHVGAVNRTVGETSYRDVGLYAQASYSLTNQLKLTGGFRYTWDRQTNVSTRTSTNFAVTNYGAFPPVTFAGGTTCTDPGQAPLCTEHLAERSQKPTWLVDLDYHPTQDILLYAKYSRGYRAGGVFANGPIDHRTFGPEQVDSYEAGLKTTFRGAVSGTFNVTGFYNDFSNQQLQFGFDARIDPATGAPAPVSPTTGIINAGRSRIYGAEVEASIRPFRGFVFDGSYTYLNATIRSISPVTTIDPNYQSQVTQITPGSPLVLSPRNKFSVTGAYTLPLAASVGRITFSATYTHSDSQLTSYAYLDPAVAASIGGNFGTVQPRDLVNLNLNWDNVANSGFDVAGFVTNLTNQHYYAFVPGLVSSGSEYAVLGEPRFYGVRVRYRFGG